MEQLKSTITVYEYSSEPREFNIPFDYLKRDFISVNLAGDGIRQLKLAFGVDYRFVSKTTILILRPYQQDEGYNKIIIRRITDATKRIINFQDGSILNASELNISQLQSLHVAEEARDLANYTLFVDGDNNLDARGRRIINLGEPILSKDAATKNYVDTAKDGVGEALSKTEGFRDEAERFRNEAEGFRNEAEGFKTKAEGAKKASEEIQLDVTSKASQVNKDASKVTQLTSQAQTSASEAKVSQTKAKESEVSSSKSADRAEEAARRSLGVKPVGTLEELKTLEPNFEGELIYLNQFTSTNSNGYGLFKGSMNKPSVVFDDGNYVKTVKGNVWVRVFEDRTSDIPNIRSASLVHTLIRKGNSNKNIVQSIAFDDVNRHVYCSYVYNDNGVEKSIINRFTLDYSSSTLVADSSMEGLNIAGHQGLGVQVMKDGSVKLWAAAGSGVADRGLKSIRFTYKPNGVISEHEEFTLFDIKNFYNNWGSSTVTVSSDNKYLITRGYYGKVEGGSRSIIRVFDLKDLESSGDNSSKFKYQWRGPLDIKEGNDNGDGLYQPIQGIGSNGNVVVVSAGLTQLDGNPKRLYTYSLEGELLDSVYDSKIGVDIARAKGNHYEYEGLAFTKTLNGCDCLVHCIVYGKYADTYGYTTGLFYNTKQPYMSVATDDSCGFYTDCTHDFGFDSKKRVTFSSRNSVNGTFMENFSIGTSSFSCGAKDRSRFTVAVKNDDGRDFTEIRANTELAKGAGINMYGSTDRLTPFKIDFYAGTARKTALSLQNGKSIFFTPVLGENPTSDLGVKALTTVDWVKKNAMQTRASLGSTDLNTLTEYGVYGQNKTADGTVSRNYPEEGFAGCIEVLPSAYDFMQRATHYKTFKVWYRNKTSGGWTSWTLKG